MAEKDSTYLPRLEPCLRGDRYLLSWKNAYLALCDCLNRETRGKRQSEYNAEEPLFENKYGSTLAEFFKDNAARRALDNPLEPFAPPSADTKTAFEALTSAINVTPTDDGSYNITQIKEDAVWLSNEAKVDEITALRLVVLEWQSRARAQLLSTGNAVGSQAPEDSFGNSLNKSAFLAGARAQTQDALLFNTSNERRARLLRIYLEEHLNVLKTSITLVQYHSESSLSVNSQREGRSSTKSRSPLSEIAEQVTTVILKGDLSPRVENFVHNFVEGLQQRMNRLQAGSGWYGAEGGKVELEVDWLEYQILEMVPMLQFLFRVLSHFVPSSKSALAFFRLMREQMFFHFQPVVASEATLELLRVMTSLVSMAFFTPRGDNFLIDLGSRASGSDPAATSAIQDHRALTEINGVLLWAAAQDLPFAGLPIYAWVTFLASWVRVNADLIENDSNQTPGDSSHYSFTTTENLELLALQAVDRFKFFDLMAESVNILRASYRFSVNEDIEAQARREFLSITSFSLTSGTIGYGPDLIGGLLAVLDADRSYWDFHDDPQFCTVSGSLPLSERNDLIVFLRQAGDRFPLESAPYVRLMRAVLLAENMEYDDLDSFLSRELFSSAFTERLNPEFSSYEQDEVDIMNIDGFYVRLLGDLPLFLSDSRSMSTEIDDRDSQALVQTSTSPWIPTQIISAGTRGEVRDDSQRPLIITWEHEYSQLHYLIDGLATATPGSNHIHYADMTGLTLDDIIDTIAFLNALLTALSHSRNSSGEAEQMANTILSKRFNDQNGEKDLIAAIYDIFEYQLQQQREPTDGASSAELLAHCIQFFHAASIYQPGRIWPLFARSGLLGFDGGDCGLATIVTAVEMVDGQYGFLISCLRLFDALIDLSFKHKPTNVANGSKTLTRFAAESNNSSFHVPAKTIQAVITGFLRALLPMFESCRHWRYVSSTEQFDVNTWLLIAFEKILKVTYGYDDNPDLHKKFTAVLAEPATVLTELFLSIPSKRQLSSQLIDILSRPVQPPTLGLEKIYKASLAETEAALRLCTTLLRIGIFRGSPSSSLEAQLFGAAPVLARLFVTSESLMSPVAALIDVLLTISTKHNSPPPSLLGHMGSDTAKSFLAIMTQVNRPLENVQRDLNIWRLAATIVSSQQQWFALFLLTGRAPREGPNARTENGHANGAMGRAVFSYALDKLSTIATVSHLQLAIPLEMLKFVAVSYNHWPWAVNTLRAHETFIPAISAYFGQLRREDTTSVKIYMEAAIAASIAEILTMHLHTSRQLGDIKPATDLVNKLGYLKLFGFEPPNYVSSLLHQNIEKVYPALKVSHFKHTLVFPVEYGENYFYDLSLTLECMKAAPASPGQKRNPRGLLIDLETENVMLSKVDAQMLLHSKCKLLAMELAQVLAKDPQLVLFDPLVDVLKQCLRDVEDKGLLPISVLDKFTRSRIELSLLLFQKLAVIQDESKAEDLESLFPLASDFVRSLIPDFDFVYSGKQVDMNRQLLRILFLSLQPLTRQKPASPRSSTPGVPKASLQHVPPKESALLLDVLSDVVTKGFKSIAAILHEAASACEPSDFALITAILQTILKIPGTDHLYSQISLQFINNSLGRYAASLFSWSDQLLIDDDPVYGEHSILFLLELSSIPTMAETLAVEGILSQLSSANLMRQFGRPNGMGPFDSPVRLHSIWARGILPLCLNLLDAVGPPVAGEVVSFLNQYPNQLQRLVSSIANRRAPIGTRPGDTHLTLNMAAEAHSLALIWLVVERYRAAGPGTAAFVPEIPALEWDKASIKEDVEDWLQGSVSLRDRILPANEREAELSRMRPVDPGSRCENRLQERVWAEFRGVVDCFAGNVDV